MSVLAVDSKRIVPYLYIRNNIPVKYIQRLKDLCSEIIIEPWEFGDPEPEPRMDLTKCNVMITIGMRDTLNILPKAPNLKWIHSTSVGLDAMLGGDVKNSDIIITNVKGCTSIPIAEHTIAMMSALSKEIPTMLKNQAAKDWGLVPTKDLMNSTVGIIGYGEIGMEIAKRCKALGMKVIGCKRRPTKRKLLHDPADVVVSIERINEVLAQSDFLVLALPSTKETLHFIDKEKLNQLKKGSYIINVGRGNTMVEEDLAALLKRGHIAGAALDVFEVEPLPKNHPFWEMDNVIVSPHNAYYSPSNSERMMDLFIENLQRFSQGKPLLNVVDKNLGY